MGNYKEKKEEWINGARRDKLEIEKALPNSRFALNLDERKELSQYST